MKFCVECVIMSHKSTAKTTIEYLVTHNENLWAKLQFYWTIWNHSEFRCDVIRIPKYVELINNFRMRQLKCPSDINKSTKIHCETIRKDFIRSELTDHRQGWGKYNAAYAKCDELPWWMVVLVGGSTHSNTGQLIKLRKSKINFPNAST